MHPYAWTRCTRPGTGFRLDSLSQVPTVIEQGVKDYEAVVWFGLATPAGTPEDVVNKIAEDLRASLAESEVRSKLIGGGMFPAFLSSPVRCEGLYGFNLFENIKTVV